MVNVFEHKDRRVIPNFRNFRDTLELGELNEVVGVSSPAPDFTLHSNIRDWKRSPSIGTAGDLISGAIVSNMSEEPAAQDAAVFILRHRKDASHLQIELAQRILKGARSELSPPSSMTLEGFISEGQTNKIRGKIILLKKAVRTFDHNPLAYVELARLYSILGVEQKARKNMLLALALAPHNRYVLRSFVRLMAHYREVEYAYGRLHSEEIVRHDPWLLSAELALATILGRNPTFFKEGKKLLSSGHMSPYSLTELASSLGTIELLDGHLPKSKDFFRKALLAPNDNSLAQVGWAVEKAQLFPFEAGRYKVKNNYEALAFEAFYSAELMKTVEFAEKWFLDMPFAKRPVMLGSHVAGTLLDDQVKAETFCRAGLVAHPNDPQLTNNLAYALALKNQTSEALRLLNSVSDAEGIEDTTRVCLTATRGLILFRDRKVEEGRQLYLQAIDHAIKIRNKVYQQVAFLNYVREEILAGSPDLGQLIEQVSSIRAESPNSSVTALRKRVIDLLQKVSNRM
jgi:tetratricopeptide (TPR) repeat protein